MKVRDRGAAVRAAKAAVRDCADTMEAQAMSLREAIADLPMDAALRAKAGELCAGLTDTAGRVTFELALLETELSGARPGDANTGQRLVGLEAAMMGALAPFAELADQLEHAAEIDSGQERAFVLVIEATGVMLQGIDKAKAATQALGAAVPADR